MLTVSSAGRGSRGAPEWRTRRNSQGCGDSVLGEHPPAASQRTPVGPKDQPQKHRRPAVGVSARQFVSVGVLLAALFGLFIAAESGQQRLADASRRVETAALRHRVLSEILQLLT